MKHATKTLILTVAGLAVLAAIAVWPGFPWSSRCRHIVSRLRARIEVCAATIAGQSPRLVSLQGRLIIARPDPRALKGAELEVVDSVSGWAAVSDDNGSFTIRDVSWYPGVRYKLLIAPNPYQARQLLIGAPDSSAVDFGIQVGELNFDQACPVDMGQVAGRQSITHLKYDDKNADYYRHLFYAITKDAKSDWEKIDAVNRYVSTRLITRPRDERPEDPIHRDSESPRCVVENGTRFCGKLALALATIVESVDYNARLIDLIRGGPVCDAHAVAEIYYDDQWHLYDPTSGLSYKNHLGQVASYKELRLRPGLMMPGNPPTHLPAILDQRPDGFAGLFRPGAIHYYYIDK
jgi:hypothetical protein